MKQRESTLRALLSAGILLFGMGSGRAYQLKKVMVINLTGGGGSAQTNQINFISNYIKSYLGPKFGFSVKIPANQTALDSVFRDDSLSTYDVVIFNGGSQIGGDGAVGDTGAKNAFQRWLKHGGGLVGLTGVMDHNNTWPWLRDSVLAGSIFTVHSNWGSDPNAKVQWDTLETNGLLNSLKPEYDSLRACFPPLHNNFTYPDGWWSFSMNPRPYVDILLTIDEATYTIPSGGTMGSDHPVAWAYHLPSDEDGNIGRFIYNQRGDDVGAWDGTSANHAPVAPAPINGIVYSDTSKTLMTKGFLWQSIRWAAGLMVNTTSIQVSNASFGGIIQAQKENAILRIRVTSPGKHEVNVYTLSGRKVGRSFGKGDAQYFFSNLKSGSLYIVQVKASGKSYTQRVLL